MKNSKWMFMQAIGSFLRHRRYRNLTVATFGVLVIGIFGFKFLEDWSWLNSTNYAVSTMVTTGNAEIYPKSDAGKIFNIFYMLLSVILILFFVNTLNQHFFEMRQSKESKYRRHHKIVEKKLEDQDDN